MALQIYGQTFEISKKALTRAAREAFLILDDDFETNFRFISEAKMKSLNKVYRNKIGTTDVLSFKVDDDSTGGDIVICYKEMKRRAKNWGMSESDVASFLLIHGILHLAGYDHTNEPDRVRMEQVEDLVIGKLGIRLER